MDVQQFLLLTCVWFIKTIQASHFMLDMLKEADSGAPSGNSLSFSRDRDGWRPHPSDSLPVGRIIENPDKSFDPRTSDLDNRKLRKMLGDKYDKNFMSINRPMEHILRRNGSISYKVKDGRPLGRKPDYIKSFGSPVRLGDKRKAILRIKQRTKRKLQKYLWSYTNCPVVYKWSDLGVRYWPRWVNEGSCYNGRSCSIPPGMSCKKKLSTYITIFRWICKDWKKNGDCSWIYMQYPIITECACSCPGSGD